MGKNARELGNGVKMLRSREHGREKTKKFGERAKFGKGSDEM